MKLDGIHHISAITGDAPANLDFYTGVLGMRLAAKTVNQDDPRHYHLFYADENASPGADLTFFEYQGVPVGRAGSGMVHRIAWRVGSADSLDFWQERLGDEGVPTDRDARGLRFADREGLGHELVVDQADPPLAALHPEIPPEHAIGGFVGVRAYARAADRSAALLEGAMGALARGEATYEVRGENRGGTIRLDPPPAERAVRGAGTVHHIAWATTVAEHPLWRAAISAAGSRPTDVIDRYYFHSIYFREPSGILYEIADDAPGFTRDMPLEELGSRVILPSWLEPRRDEIEAGLTPLPDPRPVA